MGADRLMTLTIHEAGTALRRREVIAVDLAEAALARIADRNPLSMPISPSRRRRPASPRAGRTRSCARASIGGRCTASLWA
jgi:Asp-tRNA(Asn)/Glu-tRNA(Gln) amidotransferase A subunit family amidase